jgi:hypothetical protein
MLKVLIRLLPKEFRERVLEPALADLRLDEHASPHTRGWHLIARGMLMIECVRLGVPQLVWRRGRPTRLGVIAVLVIALASLAAQRIRYAERRASSEVRQHP